MPRTVIVTVPATVQMRAIVDDDGSVRIEESCVVPNQTIALDYRHVHSLADYLGEDSDDQGADDVATSRTLTWLDQNEWPTPMPLSADGLKVG